jgi:cyclophilin family peptidyl-prolyl cis-trans isomerase/HEAT repeat protein
MTRRFPFVALLGVLVVPALSACDPGVAPAATIGPPVRPPVLDALAPPWSSAALREVVDLQVERDGPALRARLSSDDPQVRARAAFALASVQDPEAQDELLDLLADAVAEVRREAAFAVGQLELDGAAMGRLVGALGEEEDRSARIRIVEALGKRGDEAVAEALLSHAAADDVEEAHLALALSRLGLRGVTGGGPLVDTLFQRLVHPDPEVRRMAGYYFGRGTDPEPWSHRADELREILAGYEPDEPAAKHLIIALGLLRDRDSLDVHFRFLTEPEDWRIRASAARSLATTSLLEAPGVRDALFERVERDPSMHVALAAATTLTMGLRVPREAEDRMSRWVLEGPRERWPTHLPFVEYLASGIDAEPIMAWTRRMERVHPTATVHGLQALLPLAGLRHDILPSVERLLDHGDPLVRASALAAMGHRWQEMTFDEEVAVGLMERFERVLRDGTVPEIIAVLGALSAPSFIMLGSSELLAESLASLDPDTPTPVVVTHLQAAGHVGGDRALSLVEAYLDHPEPRIRAAAGEAWQIHTRERVPGTELPDPERTVDWAALESLGPDPRLHLETERGEIVVRLLPDRAPLTVQSMAALVEDGAYDGTRFHRVVPNFVIQGGDVVVGDGTGPVEFAIRSEFTPVPFHRGVVGMASSGKDTEGSQFFLTHSMQAHLDGGYTAFGWVESGEAALDAIRVGDRIERARIVTGDAAGS